MMGILPGSDFEIDCKPDKKNKQMLCKAKRGEKEAVILANIGDGGEIDIEESSGSIDLQERILGYMKSKVGIVKKPSRYGEL